MRAEKLPRKTGDISLIFLILLGAIPVGMCSPKVDPATGRIRLLMIGEIDTRHQQATYFLLSDPMVDLTLIPAGDIADIQTSKRFIRMYVPRTRKKLVLNFDVIELFDFVPYILMDKHIQWMHDAVRDNGLGLSLVEMGWYGVTDWTGNDAEAWMTTVLYQAYPADLVIGKQNTNTLYMDIVTKDPLVDLPEFEKIPVTDVQHHGIQVAREGSTVYARWRTGKEDAIVGGRYGSGTTLMIPMGWDNVPETTERRWDYYVDFVINHGYYVANVPLPEDPNLARRLRMAFNEYLTRKSLAGSLLDFISKFGAKTDKVERMIGNLETEKKQAERLYIEGDYEGAWEVMDEVLKEFTTITEQSMKLRQNALFWIYIIEWAVTTGTLFMTGVVLWTLMIRRRLYRQVSITRSRPG